MLCYRGHCDDGPPVRIEHRVESCLLLLLLEDEDQGGEHDGAHAQQQEQQHQLLVVGPHRVSEGLETGRVFGCTIIVHKLSTTRHLENLFILRVPCLNCVERLEARFWWNEKLQVGKTFV